LILNIMEFFNNGIRLNRKWTTWISQ
jgi:hypothetical protein